MSWGKFAQILCLTGGLLCPNMVYAQGGPQASNDEIIVKMRDQGGFKKTEEAHYKFLGKAHAQKGLSLRKSWGKMGLFHFKMQKGKSMNQTLEDLRNDPDVEYAEPNYIFTKADVGNKQVYNAAEHEQNAQSGGYMATGAPIQATDSWPTLTGSTTPVVAVIDTGVDIDHDVFEDSGAIWVNAAEQSGTPGVDDDGNGYVDDIYGWDFVNNSATMIDDDGHGTHVAGTVLAATQDIFDSSVEAAKIRIMPLKFLDSNGTGRTSDAVEAIYYAVANGATVLNNSWGGPSYSAALHEAISYAYSQGVVFVAAAGNASSNNDSVPMYPANYSVPNVIAVAATNDYDYLASFSNFGRASVLLASPGSAIYSVFSCDTVSTDSTSCGSFATMYGTSMAAPFVAGAAALVKLEQPSMLGYQVKDIVSGSADSQSSLANKLISESRLNVLSSVSSAQSASVSSTQPSYTFINQDRGLASEITSTGCGTVTKMYMDANKRGGSGPGTGAETWYIMLVIGLLTLPMFIVNFLRSRNPENRREHERFNIDTDVRVKVGDRELVGSISTISLGGVQLNTDQLLEDGGIVSMSIRSPDGKEAVAVEGRVVWSERKKAYGVQFEGAEQNQLAAIKGWTKALNKA